MHKKISVVLLVLYFAASPGNTFNLFGDIFQDQGKCPILTGLEKAHTACVPLLLSENHLAEFFEWVMSEDETEEIDLGEEFEDYLICMLVEVKILTKYPYSVDMIGIGNIVTSFADVVVDEDFLYTMAEECEKCIEIEELGGMALCIFEQIDSYCRTDTLKTMFGNKKP